MFDKLQAWVEFQYTQSGQNGTNNLPGNMGCSGLCSTMTMAGIQADSTGQVYNNPFEMVPTAGQMFKQMSATFLSVTSTEGSMNIIIK